MLIVFAWSGVIIFCCQYTIFQQLGGGGSGPLGHPRSVRALLPEEMTLVSGVSGRLKALFFCFFGHVACRILVSLLGIEPMSPAVEGQSPSH